MEATAINSTISDLSPKQVELVRKIESYGARYDPFAGLTLEDQLLACEAISESTPIKQNCNEDKETTNNNAVVSGLVSGTRKNDVNFELTERRRTIITELKACTYRTPPVKIAQLLEELFSGYGTIRGWWLSVAQQWNPRAINRNLDYMVKRSNAGFITFNNPAAYFTGTIQYRKRRKEFRSANDTRRRHNQSKECDL